MVYEIISQWETIHFTMGNSYKCLKCNKTYGTKHLFCPNCKGLAEKKEENLLNEFRKKIFKEK